MKRIAIILVLVLTFGAVFAQKGKVNSALAYIDSKNLSKAKENLELAVENEKSKDWPKTYYAMGRLYHAIYESENDADKQLYEGDVLVKAYEMYKKALDIDEKKTMQKEVDLMITVLNTQFINRGVEEFGAEDYEKAMASFDGSIKLNKDFFEGTIDTAVVFNAGLAAYNAKNYEKAVDYFKQTAATGYGGGQVYLLMEQSLKFMGDTATALTYLQEGFEKYPEDDAVLTNLINHYLITDDGEAALDYLKIAMERDPNNSSYYYAQGTVLDKLEMKEEAIESYKKGLELDPTNFNCAYNVAVIYYNQAVKIFDEAANEMDDKKYQAMVEKGNKELEKALPYMETASEINPNEMAVWETLKTLYYRLKMMDKFEEVKTKIENM